MAWCMFLAGETSFVLLQHVTVIALFLHVDVMVKFDFLSRYSTLISIKLAKMLMSRSASTAPASASSFSSSASSPSAAPVAVGVVVSLLTDSASWMPHRDLADAMGLRNNFLCHGKVHTYASIVTM